MKRYCIFLFFLLFQVMLTAQNDCTDALVVCGNTGYQGLTATGFGTQELDNTNTCQSAENNSLWLRLPVNTGGTLGFRIIPGNTSINVDFDFFIFGPDATCGNLGQAIRCSTTNPDLAGAFSNHTGMDETSADTAEGPGELGDSFVQWLTVEDGENYFLVIDRPVGSSDFSIEWTGTATFHDAAVFNNPGGTSLDMAQCDSDGVDDQSTAFNLTANSALLVGNQANVSLTYHVTQNDAIVGENPIPTPGAYSNIANPQVIYMRMTNTITGCFETDSFQIEVTNTLTAGTGQDIALCDSNENGLRAFNLALNDDAVRNGNPDTAVTYYASQQDAINKINPLGSLYINQTPYAVQTIWARLDNISGCFASDITSFTITVTPLPDFDYTLEVVDFRSSSNSINVEISNPELYDFSLDGTNFSDNAFFENLVPGPYTVHIRAKSGCKTVTEEVVILNYPRFFTPNGDGVNDVWQIAYMRLNPQASVTIFDRYGKPVGGFKGAAGWDGSYNGSPLPATDYWFVIQLDNSRIIKGHFSMIR